MSVPSISIVIPVHNGGENFRKCLASVQQFVPIDTEIIVVVDGGTDNSGSSVLTVLNYDK
jgi:glycosyltransferase involved in cell wall biosynthesis